jgi:uncharacterized protein DUF5047
MVTAADFAPLIAGSHMARFRCVAVDGFQTGGEPTGIELPVIDGSIEFDSTADIRASGSVELVGDWPTSQNLSLAPYGAEVFLSRGVDRGANGVLWAPMGYFRISEVSQNDAAKGPVKLNLDDRMATIIDSRFMQPRQWVAGVTVGEIISDTINTVYDDAVVVFDDDSDLVEIGRSLIVEESRYELLLTIAEGLGKVVYWDELGRLVFRTIPDSDEVTWAVKAGPGGAMVQANRSLSREGVYNAVVVTGEGADELTPVRAVAFDAQQSSPTFFDGPFGRVPRFYSSPFITTQPQASNAARNLLLQSLGAPYDVGLSAVPNPAVRPYDVLRITYNNGNRELHIVERATIPMNVDSPVKVATRESTVIFVGIS